MLQNKQQREYSKTLLIQESALIWVITIGMMFIALICILEGYTGSLPWLAAMVGFPWTAYGVSQAFYYKKSEKENTKDGIKFESVMAEINNKQNTCKSDLDWTAQSPVIDQSGNEIDLDYGL